MEKDETHLWAVFEFPDECMFPPSLSDDQKLHVYILYSDIVSRSVQEIKQFWLHCNYNTHASKFVCGTGSEVKRESHRTLILRSFQVYGKFFRICFLKFCNKFIRKVEINFVLAVIDVPDFNEFCYRDAPLRSFTTQTQI